MTARYTKPIALLVCLIICRAFARAQDCGLPLTFCERLKSDMVVFVGREIQKESLTNPADHNIPSGAAALVTFIVDESLWGLPEKTQTVSVKFPDGYITAKEPTLVFAMRIMNGDYSVSECSGGFTLPLDHVWTRQFREYLGNSTPAKFPVEVVADKAYTPLSDTHVQMQGKGGNFTGVTDQSGKLTFSSMPPGTYRVKATKANYSLRENLRFSILPGSCATLMLTMQSVSHLSGQILDSSGNPVRGVRGFELIGWREDQDAQDFHKSRTFETDEEGQFSLEGLVPGRYYLGANLWENREPRITPFPTTYYPGVADRAGATPLVIQAGKSLSGIVFHLPDYGDKRHLAVHVVDANGAPVPHAIVEDGPAEREATHVCSLGPFQFTNDQGVAEFDLWASSEYSIDARLVLANALYQSEPVRIQAAGSSMDITIVLKNLHSAQ